MCCLIMNALLNPEVFLVIFTVIKCVLAFLGPFADQNNRFPLPFYIFQLVKSLRFHMPKPDYILGHIFKYVMILYN